MNSETILYKGSKNNMHLTNQYAKQIQISNQRPGKNPIIILSGADVAFTAYVDYEYALEQLTNMK